MEKLNKQFTYKEYTFNIKIELKTKIEKRIGGKIWHTVTTNDMGAGSYYSKELVSDDLLESYISKCRELAYEYVDSY